MAENPNPSPAPSGSPAPAAAQPPSDPPKTSPGSSSPPGEAKPQPVKPPDILQPGVREAAEKAKADAAGAKKPEEKKPDEADNEYRKRLVRLAHGEGKVRKGREALDADRKAFDGERAALTGDAEKWRAAQAAKKAGNPIEALQALFSREELSNLYNRELTDVFLESDDEASKRQLDPDKVAELAAAKVAEQRRKDAAAAQMEEEKRNAAVVDQYVAKGDEVWDAKDNAAKWPTLRALADQGFVDRKGHIGAYLTRARGLIKESGGKLPTAVEVLDKMEAAAAAKLTPRQAQQDGKGAEETTPTVTADMGASQVPETGIPGKTWAERKAYRLSQIKS